MSAVDPRIRQRLLRATRELSEAAAEAEKQLGRPVCLFAESGSLHLIDSRRDDALCEDGANSLLRARPYEDGGSILVDLGGTRFDGGGW